MTFKIKIPQFIKRTLAAALLATTLSSASAYAASPPPPTSESSCHNTRTEDALHKCITNNQIIKDVQAILNALTIGVGLIIVIMIIVGGIQYMAAGDSPDQVKNARKRITNALIALFAYLFLAAFLQWLVPGGIFD